MKYKKIILILLFLTLVIMAGCKKDPPTKYIKDIDEANVYPSGNGMQTSAIVDSQGNVLYTKDLSQPGGILRELFIKDDKLFNTPTIGSFIRAQGAKTSGSRDPSDYYPVNIKSLLNSPVNSNGVGSTQETNNIFNHDYWTTNEGLSNLKQLERDNLKLSDITKSISDRDKEFFIEEDRLCVQGGKIISNILYYRSENSGCYGKSNAECRPHFAEFPMFKSCSSLTNLKDTFNVPNWEDYSVSCNYNSNFATLPSFMQDINTGYSHCLLKNNNDSNTSTLVGYGVGNPHLENVSSLQLSIEDILNDFKITSKEEISTSQITVKNITQMVQNVGKRFSKTESKESCNKAGCDTVTYVTYSPITNNAIQEIVNNSKYNNGMSLLAEPLRGTTHINSYQDKVASNYLLLESTAEEDVPIKQYRVTLENNEIYYVYMDEYSSWYAASTEKLNMSEFHKSHVDEKNLPPRSSERILIQKAENGKNFILTEESETLYYKGNNLFNADDSYTTLPIYILQIEGVSFDACERYFASYEYKTDVLDYEDALMCKVEGSTLIAHLSERYFSSSKYLESNEVGLGYVVMRNILYPN